MIFEMRAYRSAEAFEDEENRYCMIWQDRADRGRPSGKLLHYLNDEPEEFAVPEGIETIGAGLFVMPDWDFFDNQIKKVTIPASVRKVEEGAFDFTQLKTLKIHPDSPCGLTVKDGVVYANGGKTLFFVLDGKTEFVIPEGVTRIARGACSLCSAVTIPASVTSIGTDENGEAMCGCFLCVTPGSYAEKFAREQGLDYEAKA